MKNIKNMKGFSIMELMIVVAIIGILSLMAQPLYSDYVLRVRLTALIQESMGFFDQIKQEFFSNDEDPASVMLALESLCISPPVHGISGSNHENMKCQVQPIFSSITQISTSSPVSIEVMKGEYSYVIYNDDGNTDHPQINLRINRSNAHMLNDGEDFLLVTLYDKNVKFYTGEKGKTMQINFIRAHPYTHAWNLSEVYRKDGTVEPVKRNKWYCGFYRGDGSGKYYIPSASARPTVCKYLSGNTQSFFEM